MARIAGIDLPNGKRMDIALTYIFGIGRTSAKRILDTIKVDHGKKPEDLSDAEISAIRTELDEKFLVEGDLRRDVAQTSSDTWSWAPIVGTGTDAGSRYVGSAHTPTPGPARDPRRRLPARRFRPRGR